MKTGLLLGLVAISFAVTAYGKEPATGLKTDKQKFSYTVGFQLGQNLKRQNLDLDSKIVAEGIQHALTGATPKMSQERKRNRRKSRHWRKRTSTPATLFSRRTRRSRAS